MSVRGFEKQAAQYNPQELNSMLERFCAELKKTNGKDYEPDSLRVMLAGIDRYAPIFFIKINNC